MKFLIVSLLMFSAACTPLPGRTLDPDTAVTSPPAGGLPTTEPYVNPFSPKPGDEQLTRGEILLKEASLVIRESFPPQISLSLGGDLPTPCHELRVEIASPDPENKIRVDAYSLVDSNAICIQVLEPFQEYIDLGTFPTGHYSVWVNGQLAGEFDT